MDVGYIIPEKASKFKPEVELKHDSIFYVWFFELMMTKIFVIHAFIHYK